MGSKDKKSKSKERKKVKTQIYEEPIIEELKEKLDLPNTILDASLLIFRLFVGLGKGLTDSQKKSFAAASVWYATKVINGKPLSKKRLSDSVNISPRTLTRRFNELENGKDSKLVLDYVKQEIKKWNKERDKRLKRLL